MTGLLGKALPAGTGPGWRERGQVVVMLAVAIVLGATSLLDAEALLAHQAGLFGAPASDSTMRRTLAAVDEKALAKIAKARARARRHVWNLLALRPGGFPWLNVAGKRLAGWIVIDIDATIITSASKKAGAAATFKRTFGFHPLAAWCANTQECLAMLLREGNAGANTVADHLRVLAESLLNDGFPAVVENATLREKGGINHWNDLIAVRFWQTASPYRKHIQDSR